MIKKSNIFESKVEIQVTVDGLVAHFPVVWTTEDGDREWAIETRICKSVSELSELMEQYITLPPYKSWENL